MPFFLIKFIPLIFTLLWYAGYSACGPILYFLIKPNPVIYSVIHFFIKLTIPDQVSVLEETGWAASIFVDLIVICIFLLIIACLSFPLFRNKIRKYLQKVLCKNLNSISISKKYIEENSPLPPSDAPSNKVFPLSLKTGFKQYFFSIQLDNFLFFLSKKFSLIT